MEALMNQLADYIDLQFTRESKTDEARRLAKLLRLIGAVASL